MAHLRVGSALGMTFPPIEFLARDGLLWGEINAHYLRSEVAYKDE
jgi:hypothetical protein